MRFRIGLLCVASLCWFLSLSRLAMAVVDSAPANPHELKTRVQSVAVFKNGLGFFMREGDVTLRDGWCQAEEIPPAVFGTLAIFAHDEHELIDIVGAGQGEVTAFDDHDAPADEATIRARLQASLHMETQLTYRRHDRDADAAGKLVSIGPKYAILENDAGSQAVPVAEIRSMKLTRMPLRMHVARDVDAPQRKGDSTRIGVAYLRSGITWIPEYTIRILDDDTAELTLRGTLVNEAEDLIHADVHFVVGVPHFTHTQYMAPVAVGQAIRAIGAATAPIMLQNQFMNRAALANDNGQRQLLTSGNAIPADERLASTLGNLPPMQSAAATDYTTYTRKDMTIRRGEKAIVMLFRKQVKYSHVYRWTPPGEMHHFLVLHNDTDTAFTTDPALAISDSMPLGEDILKYTPKGGRGEFPITQAINIATRSREQEVDRELKAFSPRHDRYLDLVTLGGELLLRNFEDRPADLHIELNLPGHPTFASDDGDLQNDPSKLSLTDRAGVIRWSITLKPGESRKVSYKYQRYVPTE